MDKKSAWEIIRPILGWVLGIAIACVVIYFSANVVLNKFIYPVDPNDATPIEVKVKKGMGASDIAKLLYEACGKDNEGLIHNKAVFKVYVDFTGKAKKLQPGTHILSKNMTIPEIVDILCEANLPKVTIVEGMTIDSIADLLVKNDIISSADEFKKACNDYDRFKVYQFVEEMDEQSRNDKKYLLEGYLFPDTYELNEGANSYEIVNKMLNKFNTVFNQEYKDRAEQLGMSIEDIVKIASIIECEAMPTDYSKVSAVIYNRLSKNMKIQSDATIQYITGERKLIFTQEELNTDSKYNTHLYEGLPVGAISNPGLNAIEAALNPDPEYVSEEYLYFCLKDSKTGELVFAKTLEEHNANVEKYKPNW